MTQAMFRCDSVTRQAEAETVEFFPVQGPIVNHRRAPGPNASWATDTAVGKLKLTITEPKAFQKFDPGKFYSLEIKETVGPDYTPDSL